MFFSDIHFFLKQFPYFEDSEPFIWKGFENSNPLTHSMKRG